MRMRKTLLTADELLRLSTTGGRYELVEGELFEMPPAGGVHGYAAMRIGSLLDSYVSENQLGYVFAAEAGFILRRNPDTVRAPDASFVSKDRLGMGDLPSGYVDVVPDLAVEVVSPSDRQGEVLDKVEEWLRAGTKLVWVIYPATRSATVHQSLGEHYDLTEADTLDGAQVVPGFTCNIKELWD